MKTEMSPSRQPLKMDDIINKSFIGTSGFLASVGLAQISEIVSLIVGLATLAYMGLNIWKLVKEMQ